jgi:hypothetical protein
MIHRNDLNLEFNVNGIHHFAHVLKQLQWLCSDHGGRKNYPPQLRGRKKITWQWAQLTGHVNPCGSVSKPCTPVVHIKIAGKWMFIPLKMVFS